MPPLLRCRPHLRGTVGYRILLKPSTASSVFSLRSKCRPRPSQRTLPFWSAAAWPPLLPCKPHIPPRATNRRLQPGTEACLLQAGPCLPLRLCDPPCSLFRGSDLQVRHKGIRFDGLQPLKRPCLPWPARTELLRSRRTRPVSSAVPVDASSTSHFSRDALANLRI